MKKSDRLLKQIQEKRKSKQTAAVKTVAKKASASAPVPPFMSTNQKVPETKGKPNSTKFRHMSTGFTNTDRNQLMQALIPLPTNLRIIAMCGKKRFWIKNIAIEQDADGKPIQFVMMLEE